MWVVALLGWFALGLTRPAAVAATDPSTAPMPPMPPAAPSQPANGVKPTTNPVVRPRPLQAPPANPVPAPRFLPSAVHTNSQPTLQPFPLVFDAESKTVDAQPGQTNITFTFKLTNASPAEVTIDRVQTSCGCTVARLPTAPWKLAPGDRGEFQVVADLRGKRGLFSKMVYVYTPKGFKALNVRVNIVEPTGTLAGDRLRNLQIATADRQAVFRGDCARCHSTPGVGKKGRELYQSLCGVCHEAEHRATMVADLRNLRSPADADHWRNWITHGKAGTLMPAFAQTEGGPLTLDQIDSLVAFLVEHVPLRSASAPVAPATPHPAPTAP